MSSAVIFTGSRVLSSMVVSLRGIDCRPYCRWFNCIIGLVGGPVGMVRAGPRSMGLNVGVLDDAAPHFGFLLDKGRSLGGCAAGSVKVDFGKVALCLRTPE